MSSPSRRAAFTLVELLVVIAVIGILVALLLPAVQAAREAGRRTQCLNNVKQLGVAFHNYHDTQRGFPPRKTTRPKDHNWVPFILPYAEQQQLHDLYRFDRNWSHASNQTAINTYIDFLHCPSTASDHKRLAEIGGGKTGSTSDYAPISTVAGSLVKAGFVDDVGSREGALLVDRLTRMEDILDGSSMTIMLTEDAGRPDFWLRGGRRGPKNSNPGGGNLGVNNGEVKGAAWADYRNGIPLHGFTRDGKKAPGPCAINCTNNNESYSFHPAGLNVLFCDGSVVHLSEDIPIRVYAAMITRAGGDVYDNGWR